MRNRLFSLLTAASLTAFGLMAFAQTDAGKAAPASSHGPATAAKSAPQIKFPPRGVVLPVTVRDKKGAMVTNLQASDFTLTEDGHAQTIRSLTRQSDLPFRLGLLVDTSRGMSDALESVRKAANKFLEQMLPADSKAASDKAQNQAFLIHFDSEVELLEDFTPSRENLYRELDSMGTTRRTKDESRGPESNGDDRSENGEWGGRSQSRGNRSGADLYDAIYLAADELMKSQDGRKALVVFSDGLDHSSKESLNDAVDAADRANLAIYTIYFKGEQERGGSSFPSGNNGGNQRGGMGGSWPGSGGGGYPGSGGGQRGGGSDKSGKQDTTDGKKNLEKIATRTGGHFFEAKKKDNLEEIYSQIVEELRNQYILAYTPDPVDEAGGYHKIVLKTGKSDLTVSTREGYYTAGKE
jgi:VWFA-related protein